MTNSGFACSVRGIDFGQSLSFLLEMNSCSCSEGETLISMELKPDHNDTGDSSGSRR